MAHPNPHGTLSLKLKKIARRFKDKLDYGGFGSVYKGELPNRVLVAVKMLENSIGEGERVHQ